jgi:hypothetical protein
MNHQRVVWFGGTPVVEGVQRIARFAALICGDGFTYCHERFYGCRLGVFQLIVQCNTCFVALYW